MLFETLLFVNGVSEDGERCWTWEGDSGHAKGEPIK
jgi:hypothetical protein